MNAFDKAIYFVEISEGGTNHDPDDRGGLTKFGISEKQYPHINIEELTRGTATHIYFNDYWLKNRCDCMPSLLAMVMFDTGVNCGTPSAAQWLQQSIKDIGGDLAVDGVIGPVTLSYIRKDNAMKLAYGIIAHRLRRYSNLAGRENAQYKYLKGWINRVSDLMLYVL